MMPSSRTTRPRPSALWPHAVLTVTLVGVVACGTRDSAVRIERGGATADSTRVASPSGLSTPPPATIDSMPELAPPPEPRARTAEQRLLRELVDVHEAFSAIVHDRMSTRHDDHGMTNAMVGMTDDPAKNVGRLDIDIDKEKVELLARLKSVYGDEHQPRLPSRSVRRADSLARANEATGDSAYRAQLARLLRRELAVIDSARPTLHDPATRALAARHRAEARQRLALFATPTPPARR